MYFDDIDILTVRSWCTHRWISHTAHDCYGGTGQSYCLFKANHKNTTKGGYLEIRGVYCTVMAIKKHIMESDLKKQNKDVNAASYHI